MGMTSMGGGGQRITPNDLAIIDELQGLARSPQSRAMPAPIEDRSMGVDNFGRPVMADPTQRPPDYTRPQGIGERLTGILGGIGRGVNEYLADNENRARLVMALNSMRLEPDRGLSYAYGRQLENAQALRADTQSANRTAQFLASQGRDDLAQLVLTTPGAWKTALSEFYSSASKETFRDLTPDEIAAMGLPAGTFAQVSNTTGQIKIPDNQRGLQGTTKQREYEAAKGEGYTGSFTDFLQLGQDGKTTDQRNYEFAQSEAGGKYTGSFQDFLSLQNQDKPLTDSQAQSTTYYGRTLNAHRQLLMPAPDGRQLDFQGTKYDQVFLDENLGRLANPILDPEYRLFANAKRTFINSTLRRESGAAISESEFVSDNLQYFPQPGDTDAEVEQKRKNREETIRGFRIGAGRGAEQLQITPQLIGNMVSLPNGRTIMFASPEVAKQAFDEMMAETRK